MFTRHGGCLLNTPQAGRLWMDQGPSGRDEHSGCRKRKKTSQFAVLNVTHVIIYVRGPVLDPEQVLSLIFLLW